MIEFRDQKQTKDGKKGFCIGCENEWHRRHYLKNREKRIEQQTIWNKNHKDKVDQYKRIYEYRKIRAARKPKNPS